MRTAVIRTAFLLTGSITSLFSQSSWNQYRGTITISTEKKLDLELKLGFTTDSTFGTYYYTNVGTDMRVSGKLENNKITLSEYNPSGKATGTFSGTYYTKGDSIKGKWTNIKKTASYPFVFRKEDWCDYKIIEHSLKDEDEEYNWFEMTNHADTVIQYEFNNFDDNKSKKLTKGFIGFAEDGDTVPYSYCTWDNMCMKNNYFISFSFFHSDYFGGAGASNSIYYYNLDLINHTPINFENLLRTDTAAEKILYKMVYNGIKKMGEWENFASDYGADFFEQEYIYYDIYFASDGMYFFLPRQGAETNILGVSDVRIPYKELWKLLQKESVVYQWIKSTGRDK